MSHHAALINEFTMTIINKRTPANHWVKLFHLPQYLIIAENSPGGLHRVPLIAPAYILHTPSEPLKEAFISKLLDVSLMKAAITRSDFIKYGNDQLASNVLLDSTFLFLEVLGYLGKKKIKCFFALLIHAQ